MPRRCAVAGCGSVYDKNSVDTDGSPINFFLFPDPVSEKDRYHSFSSVCFTDADTEVDHSYICSLHFSSEDISGNRFLQPRLKKSALPCKHLPAVKQTLSDTQLGKSDDKLNAVKVDGLKLTDLVTSAVLPDGWCARLCSDCAVFFELSIGAELKPLIVRSVTVDNLLQATVYVGGLRASIKHQSPLSSIDSLNSLLLVVSSISLGTCSNFTKLVAVFDETISAQEQVNDSLEPSTLDDHNYACGINTTEASVSDHQYAVAAESINTRDTPLDDRSLYLGTLKFLRSQCFLLSATAACRRRYEPAFVRWCLLVYFHSPAAYRAIQEAKCLVVPSERWLRQYSAPYGVQPGLHDARQQYLTSSADRMTSLERNVSLIVDEMYVKPEISYSSGKLSGYADNRPDAVAATTILTMMVQSLCGSFRDVVAFFPVCQLTGVEEAQYIRDTIVLVENSGLSIQCVVCDNSKVNQSMFREFGVESKDVMSGIAVHPVQPDRKLFFIIDPCHLIKCIRNNWLQKGTFSVLGAEVSLDYIRQLHSKDVMHDIKLAPKLNNKVLNPTNTEKQCVRAAVSLFSPSVTAALETYMVVEPEQFSGAGPTVDFLKNIHKFWCWTNVQNIYQGQQSRDVHQQPFRLSSDFRLKEMDRLKSWVVAWHKEAPQNARLTQDTYAAFCITLESVKGLIIQLLEEEQAQFVLTGRFQQDPLEERFGAHRQRAGCSYNPSALQFQYTEKKLAVVKSVSHSKNSNTARLERKSAAVFWDNNVLPTKKCKTVTPPDSVHSGQSQSNSAVSSQPTTLCWNTVPFAGLDTIHPVERQGLMHIAGYIARKVSEKLSCDTCSALLHNGETMSVHLTDDTRELYTYLMALSRGGLLVATDTLVMTLARCRHVFKQLTLRDEFLKADNPLDQLIECATLQLAEERDELFSSHELHREHSMRLIMKLFFNLSLNRLSRECTAAVSNRKSRKLSTYMM